MKKNILLTLCVALLGYNAIAQYNLVKPNGSLEISGWVTTFYNHRFYPAGTTNFKKNRYNLDFAVLKLDGVVNKVWNYQLQLNSAALFEPDANDGFLMDAWGSFNPLSDRLEVRVGWMKLPFSRTSLVPMSESAFLQRPNVARGGTFTRRDVGTLVRYSALNKLINIYGGVFTGMGALSLQGDNDASGSVEYVGRVEFSYPARYRRTEIDLTHVKLPMFSLGVDARSANKKTTYGLEYPYELLDGLKQCYSANADFQYQGFSAHAEAIRIRMQPNDPALLLTKPTNHFRQGGFIASANYCFKKYKTVLAARFDEYNPNDLLRGDRERSVSLAANYLLDGQKSCVKVQYWKRLKDPESNTIWTPDQIRIAYQLLF